VEWGVLQTVFDLPGDSASLTALVEDNPSLLTEKFGLGVVFATHILVALMHW